MQPLKSSRDRSFLTFLVTILIAGSNNSALAAGRLVLPLIALSMGASAFLVGIISAMFTACPMMLSVWFGRWVDRTGSFFPMLVSAGLIAIASLAFIFYPSKFSLLIVAGLIGSGAVFSHVAATRAVGSATEDARKRARDLGHLILVYSLFQFIGPILAGYSLEHLGSEVALVSVGGFGVLSVLFLALGQHYYKQDAKKVFHRLPKESAWKLFAIAILRKWIVVYGVFSAAQTLYPLVISLHAVNVGLSPSQAGILLGAFACGVMVSRASTSLILRYIPGQFVATGGLAAGALVYAVMPSIHDFYPLFALSALLGLPIGLGTPISLALIYENAPEGRVNESVGLCMSVTTFLQTSAPLTLGIVASGSDIGPMIWGLSLVMVLAAGQRETRPAPSG